MRKPYAIDSVISLWRTGDADEVSVDTNGKIDFFLLLLVQELCLTWRYRLWRVVFLYISVISDQWQIYIYCHSLLKIRHKAAARDLADINDSAVLLNITRKWTNKKKEITAFYNLASMEILKYLLNEVMKLCWNNELIVSGYCDYIL